MDRFKSLIDQRVPLKYINIDHDMTSYDCQMSLINFIKSQSSQNPFYFKGLLSKYIKILEKSNEDVLDALYDLFLNPNIFNAKENSPDTPDFIKYHVSGFQQISEKDSDNIIIKEQPRLISGKNTTGLRTWEAALYLSNGLNEESSLIPFNLDDKTILELGCGTGLLSLSLAKVYHRKTKLKRIIMSDGSTTVFENFSEIVKVNNINDENLIKCQQLIWGEENMIKESIDLVIAADVTYDSTVLDPLCQTIDDLFKQNDLKLTLIACTIRNIDTINSWEEKLDKWFPNRWSIAKSEKSPGLMRSMCFFNPTTPEIRIYSIKN
ncbi:uncharacterized protein KGF55_001777 [Candida pseudojiufengensis]|uniref:uncharacterized protein n=1 Tax=Candida pseudojiufengensis TaxID=497109 RepID=UPI0022255CC6|nr:uncharacterized protein KGF55_001777 [Candida pseudojiufengensis]KAI5964708.1 hypothetical protein KGF55_001777 [Candida pseudojiufengensis]